MVSDPIYFYFRGMSPPSCVSEYFTVGPVKRPDELHKPLIRYIVHVLAFFLLIN